MPVCGKSKLHVTLVALPVSKRVHYYRRDPAQREFLTLGWGLDPIEIQLAYASASTPSWAKYGRHGTFIQKGMPNGSGKW